MRNRRVIPGLLVLLLAFASQVYAYVSENSRQGSGPVFPTSRQETTRENPQLQPVSRPSPAKLAAGSLEFLKDALGSPIALTNRGGHAVAKIGYDSWGNLVWPDKPGQGVPPMKEGDLAGYLDRMEGTRSFENGGVDPNHLGRHFVGTISPYLYASRRFDSFSNLYQNRWRSYNPQYGRFLSSDPLGFNGGNNLWVYVRNRPTISTDPFGLTVLEALDSLRRLGTQVQWAELFNLYDKADWDGIVRFSRQIKDDSPCHNAYEQLRDDPNVRGAWREIAVAEFTKGNVSRQQITVPGFGTTDIDVVAGDGTLIQVGGPQKAKNLAKFGQALQRLTLYATQKGKTAQVFLEGVSMTDPVVALAKKWVGEGNVFIFSLP